MPEPASHGYVAATGAKELEAIGATVKAGTDVSDWTVSWGQAGGGMYSTIADLGTWAATGLGTSLLPADLAAKRLAAQKVPEGTTAWASTTGATAGSATPASSSAGSRSWPTTPRPAPPSWPSSTTPGSFMTAMAVGLQVFPDLKGLLGR